MVKSLINRLLFLCNYTPLLWHKRVNFFHFEKFHYQRSSAKPISIKKLQLRTDSYELVVKNSIFSQISEIFE